MRLIVLLLMAVSTVTADFSREDLYVRLMTKVFTKLEEINQWANDPSKEDEHRKQCISGISAFLKHVNSPWALEMIDSSTKLQSGLLEGNLLDLGQYDQCLKVSVGPTKDDPDLPSFTGQHCLISNKLHISNGTMTVNSKMYDILNLYGTPYIPLTIAQCYPSLCKPKVIEEVLNSVFAVADNVLETLEINVRMNVTVHPTDCHVAKNQPFDAAEWAMLIIIILFVILAFVSTSIEYLYIKTKDKIPSSRSMKLMVSFSLYTNAKQLLSMKSGEGTIPSLNGLKFFSMCGVVIAHRYNYLAFEPFVNIADAPHMVKQLPRMIIISMSLVVDTFFFISGMLNMYGVLVKLARKKRYTIKDIWNGYVHRYLRLTPPYLIMVGFTATLQYRLREGPLWDRFVGVYKNNCRKNFWENIIYINNYVSTDDYCMMQSWYLAADMQLFVLSPFLIYPLWKWPKYGLAQLVLLIIASIVSPFMVSWYYHIASPIGLTASLKRKTAKLSELYFPTHTRSVSYLIGIGGGYILYWYRQGKFSLELNLWKKVAIWFVSAAFMLYAIFGGYYTYQLDYEYNQLFSSFYIGFQRFFWASGVFCLVLMCVKGYGGVVNTFLSLPVFIPLARQSYCIYLTHIVVLLYSIAAQRTSIYFTDYDQIHNFLGDMVLCLFSGLILSLLVEIPITNVEKLILGKEQVKEPRIKSKTKPIRTVDIYMTRNDL